MKLLGNIGVDFDINMSNTDHPFCINPILEKNLE
jgi:hypothetical protein